MCSAHQSPLAPPYLRASVFLDLLSGVLGRKKVLGVLDRKEAVVG